MEKRDSSKCDNHSSKCCLLSPNSKITANPVGKNITFETHTLQLCPDQHEKDVTLTLCFSNTLTNKKYIWYIFYQELLKENSNPRLKGNRKGIIVKGKEFYIPILNTFPTR